MNDVKIIKTKRELKVDLTQKETLDLSQSLSECLVKKRGLEEELKAYQQSKKSEITQCDAQITRESELIRRGYDWRLVNCEITYFYKLGIKRIARCDTGELIKEEPIEPHEMQTNLLDDIHPKSNIVNIPSAEA